MKSRHMQQSSASKPERDKSRQGIGFPGPLQAVFLTLSFRLKSGSVIFKFNLIRHSSISPPCYLLLWVLTCLMQQGKIGFEHVKIFLSTVNIFLIL